MSSTPLPTQLSSRERYSLSYRSLIDREAARDDSKASNPGSTSTLWQTIRCSILNTTHRYTSWTHLIADFDWDMHDLWHVFIQAARTTQADDPAQDRLVAQVLFARSLGTLRRTTTTGTEKEEAITSDGARIWTDLPYLVTDLREAWLNSSNLSPAHRHNLAAFTARLTALGICDADLSVCALWLLRTALETPRPLSPAEADSDPSKELLSIIDLLPACITWFQHSNHKLLTLSVQNHVPTAPIPDPDPDPGLPLPEPGPLAQNAGISQPGFSVPRWLFWRRRFKELSRSTCADVTYNNNNNKAVAETVAEQGKRGFNYMIQPGRELGYDVPGEAEYAAKVAQALTEELKRSGKACVTSDEVVVDLDWAD